MDDWTQGYVTELPYSINDKWRAHLRWHCRLAGRAQHGFHLPELVSSGLGLNMLAAAPAGRFFNDFMPAHVAAAQALASQASLSNLQLMQDSFAQLHDRDLPPMDFIVLHGVYTWVNADNRAHIVALIARLLKPGGVVYVSYNSMPGWANKAPLQRLMSEAAQAKRWRTAAFNAARLLGTAPPSSPVTPARAPRCTIPRQRHLLHEFAPRSWTLITPMSPSTWHAPAAVCCLGPAAFHNGRCPRS
jgi:SAM-dependent methyltransferase